ncbi:hypothetical protein EGW08_001357 [Elysia chlorotica]|uniref:FYVE-type zinc finger domain-containing protein n=1 Tax=Elysia chlorotica TaxID=188477 RepID=A0A433UAK1_ELYCH|nr:hypothetical protein EGW08_001357 [Elysia chlorotica]
MPAASFQRSRVGGKENGTSDGHSAHRVPPIKLDLRDLTDREEIMIMEVIKRDERERAILESKISEVRREIQELRKAGALVSGDDPANMCARCKAKIAVGGAAKILPWVGGERAERCVVCKFLVCPKCRSRGASGTWTCVLCLKYRQEKLLTGECFSPPSLKPEPMGSDLLRQSLRDRSGLEPQEFDDPADYMYTQRPAKAQDVDTESRCSLSSDDHTLCDNAGSGQQRYAPSSTIPSLPMLDERAVGAGKGRSNSPASSSPAPSPGRQSPGVSSLGADSAGMGSLGAAAMRARSTSASGSSSPASSISGRRSPAGAAEIIPAGAAEMMFRGRPIAPSHKASPAPPSQPHEASRSVYDSASDDAASLRSLENGTASQPNDSTNSASDPVVFYDDLKLSRPSLFLPSSSLPTSRSSSSLGSDYGNNPKYRTRKPPWARSELELFRSRAERYSLKRRQTLKGDEEKEAGGKDEEASGPASNTLVRPDGRRVSVCTPSNKWIVHWHELLRRRKSLEEMAKMEDQYTDQNATALNSPILQVSPPTPSPSSSLVQLDAQASNGERFDSDITNTVFDLCRRKDGGRGSLPYGKNKRHDSLTPPGGHSRQDSNSSAESISALVMAAQERQAVARLPSVELDELTLSGTDELRFPAEGIPIPVSGIRHRRSLLEEDNASDSSDEPNGRRRMRSRMSGSRSPSPASSRGSRPHTPISPHGSLTQSPIISRSPSTPFSSPSSRPRTLAVRLVLPSMMKRTSQGFQSMPEEKQEVKHQLEEIQNCSCGGLHPKTPSPLASLSSSPQSDLISPLQSNDSTDNRMEETPPLLRKDRSFMPPTPLPQIETPRPERRHLDISTEAPPVVVTPKLTRARRTGALSPTSLEDRQGRRLLPAPGVVVAAKARASAPGADNYDLSSADSKKFQPATRSVSMSSQDGLPEKPARRGSYTRTLGGQSVTVVPAKGKHDSSSSEAFSDDDDDESGGSRHTLHAHPRPHDRSSDTVRAWGGKSEGRRGSASSYVSYTAESVRSNSSPTNVDPSSDENLNHNHVVVCQHTATHNNNESSIHNKNKSSKTSSVPPSRQPTDKQADLPDKKSLTKSRNDINTLKPEKNDVKNKPSPSISSKFRWGRKKKIKDNEKPSERDNGHKSDVDSVRSLDAAKTKKGKAGADKTPDLSTRRSNSFEEVYDSNVNRLLETMKGSTLPNPGRGEDKKPQWEDVKVRPGPTGKNVNSFLFQHSLSLSEELAENSKWYKSCDDSENWVEESEFNNLTDKEERCSLGTYDSVVAKSTSVEKLLSPSLHERPQQQQQQQQLSREEEGNTALHSTESYNNNSAVDIIAGFEGACSSVNITGTDVEKSFAAEDTYTKQDISKHRKPPVRPQTYAEQHAALVSRNPDWDIPESLKSKLCRAGSAASDTLSIIHETSESGRDQNAWSGNERRNSGVISSDEDSDDTLFGCVSEGSFSDDERLAYLSQDAVEDSERGKIEAPEIDQRSLHMIDLNLPEKDSCFASSTEISKFNEDLVLLVFDEKNNIGEDELSETIVDLELEKETYLNKSYETDNEHAHVEIICESSRNTKGPKMLQSHVEQDIIDNLDFHERFDNSQESSAVSLADSNPECFVLEKTNLSETTSEELYKLSDMGIGTNVEPESEYIGNSAPDVMTLDVNRATSRYIDNFDSDGKLATPEEGPPLASSCQDASHIQDNGNHGEVVNNAGTAVEDGDDSSSSHTSAGSGGKKETLLKLALQAEQENHLLQRERAERARENAERRRLEEAERGGADSKEDHLAPPSKPRREPDNDSLTSGHLSLSSRDESSTTGQGGSGFFSRLKTRARRKGYPPRKPSATKPITK